MTGWTYRLRDVLVASAALLALTPVLLLIAGCCWATQGRPVLYAQVRPGRFGRSFSLYKFRSMRAPLHPTEADGPRLTAFGRALRRSSLDELPGLWNVLIGDLSLVGPRPLLTEYLGRYSEEQHIRHLVRPGMTGLAQVSGRNSLDWEERLTLDVRYVRTRTHLGDLAILARTVGVVLSRRGIDAPEDPAPSSTLTGSAAPATGPGLRH